jgi:hypothetical protein
MGDIKPIGSEKLQGDDKFKRILELTYYNQKSSNQKTSKAELVKESKNGVYGIVREKDGYYVKKGLNESSLDYIGGMFMKNKNKFSSYAEALKRLELLKGQEMLNEDITKYVLKTNKSQEEAPMPVPAVDSAPAPSMPPSDAEPAPAAPADSMDNELPTDDTAPEAQSPEESKRSDYMAEIQKFSGKLGQELRDQQPKMESDDIKYVLNMIISAVDLDKLDVDDIEEIGKKFDRDEEEMGAEDMPADDEGPDMEPESDEAVPAPEDDLAERMSKLEELINSKLGGEEETHEEALDELYFDFEDGGESDIDEYYSYDEEDFERRDKGLKPRFMLPDGTKIRPEDSEDSDDMDITPELKDINESINTTLSKYFE